MHRQYPVSYNNSYAYGLTAHYIITVIVDPPVGLCTYVLVMDVLSYLVGLYLLVLTWITYLRTCMYWYLLGLLTYLYLLTYLRSYLFIYLLTCTYLKNLLGCIATCMQLLIC